jgi:hypothetical protein
MAKRRDYEEGRDRGDAQSPGGDKPAQDAQIFYRGRSPIDVGN